MFLYPLKKESILIQIFIFLMIWIILQVVFMLVWGQYLQSNFDTTDINVLLNTHNDNSAFHNSIIWGNALQQLLTFALPVVIFGRMSSTSPFHYIGFNSTFSKYFNISLPIIIACLMMLSIPALGSLIQLLPLGEKSDELQTTRKLMESFYFNDKSTWGLFRNILLMAVIPAVCEEIFFRGGIQRLIFSSTKNIWISILSTGLFFAFLHASIINFVPILLAAIILGLIYHYTHNLLWSIIAHAIYNGTQVVVNHFRPTIDHDTVLIDASMSSSQVALLALTIIIAGIGILLILKKMYGTYLHHVKTYDQEGHWSFEQKNN